MYRCIDNGLKIIRPFECAIYVIVEPLTSKTMFPHGLFIVAVKTMSIIIVPLVILYFILIKCIYYRHRRTLNTSLKYLLLSNRGSQCAIATSNNADIRALIVTAHPDDECMFFAPTIIRLGELNATVHLLCLSEGNVC